MAVHHIIDFFVNRYSKEEWSCPYLDNLDFATIGEDRATWIEREFEVKEVKAAIFEWVRMSFQWHSFKGFGRLP